MATTHEQQIAKLRAEIAALKGEIAGLKYAVAMRPYPVQYVPAPVAPRPYVYPQPYYTYATTAGSLSPQAQGIARAMVRNVQGANGQAA